MTLVLTYFLFCSVLFAFITAFYLALKTTKII